jgi:hypothetical protein
MLNIAKISSSSSSFEDKLIKRINQIQAPEEVSPYTSAQRTSTTDSRRSTSSRRYNSTLFWALSLTKSTCESLKARSLTWQRKKQAPQPPTLSTRHRLFETDLKKKAPNQTIIQRVLIIQMIRKSQIYSI